MQTLSPRQNKLQSEDLLEVELLKGQYEREKRLVEEKVRQLAELTSKSQKKNAIVKENTQLKKVNQELTEVIKNERQIHETTVKKIMGQTEQLRKKLILIENGCAKELVLRLKVLRDEVVSISNHKSLQ